MLGPNNVDLLDVTLLCEDDSKKSISDLQMPPVRTYVGEKDAKYQKLFKMYKRAHPDKLGMDVTDEVIRIWRDTLDRGKVDSVSPIVSLLFSLAKPSTFQGEVK